MPVWCDTCRCHVNAPCVSHHRESEEQRRALCRSFRSTKGASKARRDHINHEIRNMRALLPIGQEDQERLSYLHSMAAICTYIRKSVLLHELPTAGRSRRSPPYEAFLQALHGFILVTTAQGRLVYVSENVSEYLGLSMVDVLQGDTVYDMVERSDVDIVRSNLSAGGRDSSPERSFVCCMQTSRAFKLQHGNCCSVLVRGGFRSFPPPPPTPSSPSSPSSSSSPPSGEPLFVALCTPTVNRLSGGGDSVVCQRFSSSHRLDMTFTRLSDSVSYFFGYSAEEMAGRSWYGLVHPEDLSLSANAHRSLMQAEEGLQVEMVLRLQSKDLSWIWIYTQANRELQGISCCNYIISETEARFLQSKITTDAFVPPFVANSCHFAAQRASPSDRGFKRRRTSSSQSEEPCAKAARVSEQDVHYAASVSPPVPLGDGSVLFTPPYSPASSGSPLQEELSRDLLMDVQGYADRLLSSPESSPAYYSYPDTALACHPSGSLAAPAADQTFDQGAFAALVANSPLRSTSPSHDLQHYAPDARLVPDCLSAAELCEGPTDCALHQDDLGLLEQPQGGVLHHLHQVPHHATPVHSGLLTPSQSPATAYDEREQVEISILAQQISSLASSFDMHRSLGALQSPLASPCDWPCHASPLEPELNDGVFDSILKELDMAVTRRSSAPGCHVATYSYLPGSQQLEPLGLSPTVPENAMDPLGLQLGCHDQNTGLHQLDHYMQSTPQQDGLAEESLY